MRYEVTQDLMTGNSMIDSEHRVLFDAANKHSVFTVYHRIQ